MRATLRRRSIALHAATHVRMLAWLTIAATCSASTSRRRRESGGAGSTRTPPSVTAGRARALGPDAVDARLRSVGSRRALRLRPRLDRRALAEPRLPSRAHAARARPRPLAARGEDGDVRPHRRGPRTPRRRARAATRSLVSEQATPLIQIGGARPLALPLSVGPPPAERPGSSAGRACSRGSGSRWHVVEALIAVIAGIAAGSIALIGFGADSMIEAIAGFVVIWLFTGSRLGSSHAERRAQQLIADQLLRPRRLRRHRSDPDAGQRRHPRRAGSGSALPPSPRRRCRCSHARSATSARSSTRPRR